MDTPALRRLLRFVTPHRRRVWRAGLAHRPSTIRHAGRIHVLEGGGTAEAGTQLAEAGAAFSNPWGVPAGAAISRA
jgi:ABC-type bacteriocin/lantibiotic exporter with double-glycine peptidase domain